jgi:hypothetical protein
MSDSAQLVPAAAIEAGVAVFKRTGGVCTPAVVAEQMARAIAQELLQAGVVVMQNIEAPWCTWNGDDVPFDPSRMERLGATPREVFGSTVPSQLHWADNDRVLPRERALMPAAALPLGRSQLPLRARQHQIDEIVSGRGNSLSRPGQKDRATADGAGTPTTAAFRSQSCEPAEGPATPAEAAGA